MKKQSSAVIPKTEHHEWFSLNTTYKRLFEGLKRRHTPYLDDVENHRLVFSEGGDSSGQYLGVVDTETMKAYWLVAHGNDTPLAMLKGKHPNEITFLTVGNADGVIWLSTINLKESKEIRCVETAAQYFCFKNYTDKGYKGTCVAKMADADNCTLQYEVEIDYEGNIIWESDKREKLAPRP